jgi:hypothetical protein
MKRDGWPGTTELPYQQKSGCMTKRKTERTGADARKPVNLLNLPDNLPEELPSSFQPQYLMPDPRSSVRISGRMDGSRAPAFYRIIKPLGIPLSR